jgi:hypothetical protein
MSESTVLQEILRKLDELQLAQQDLKSQFEALSITTQNASTVVHAPLTPVPSELKQTTSSSSISSASSATANAAGVSDRHRSLYPSRVILSTYPDQFGMKPYPMNWLASSPSERGPVICSRLPTSIKHRNALGAHSGSYSIYRALSVAMGTLDPNHKPDYSQTAPPFAVGPDPAKGLDFDPKRIVSFDPWGHLVPRLYKKQVDEEGLDVRPSIAITKAHIKLSEIDEAARKGEIEVDGKIVLETPPEAGGGIEIDVSKAAVEPVWWLPGVAERFGM